MIKRNVSQLKLYPHECGQGARISPGRLREIEDYCWSQIRIGVKQYELCKQLGASKSRVSRWVGAAIQRYGDFRDTRFTKCRNKTLHQSLLSRVQFSDAESCWTWRGVIKPNGYGSITHGVKNYYAHREMYKLFVEPIPENLVIDHLCKNRSCVNPSHMQVVPQSINVLRAGK